MGQLDTFAGQVTLRYGVYQGVGIYIIDVPVLYERPGSPYHDQSLYAYPDNHLRFALLSWMAAELGPGSTPRGGRIFCNPTTGTPG
ncbi:Glycogen synthase [Ewingella americana]|uniref:starch synthase n=1 Tax=Ewingella americana TaxID=41202 RepID=A0A377N8Z6_9GAMM|nr:Glycogen synthase [Ewingella americana]